MRVQSRFQLQYTELKRADPDSRQTGTAETAAPPTVTWKGLTEKRRPFSDKVISL